MAGRILIVLAALVVAALAWFATRPDERAKAGLEAPASELVAAPGARAPRESLPVPAARETGAGVPESDAPTEGAASPQPDTREAVQRAQLVTLYQHATHDASFPGDTWKLALGLTDAGYVFVDDDASAVDVPDGLRVTLYEGQGGTGHRLTLGPGRQNLAPHGFNDCVSSVRVEPLELAPTDDGGPPTLVLWRDVPPDGDLRAGDWSLVLPRDASKHLFTVAEDDFEAGAISALRVPPGHEAMLFEQPDGRGFALVLGPGYHELGPARFNDRAASIRFSRSTKR